MDCNWYLDMFHVDVASSYVVMRRIPYKIINECHSKCFPAILASFSFSFQLQVFCQKIYPGGAQAIRGGTSSSSYRFVSIVRIFDVNNK